jgi:hypothetical protein
LTFELGRNRSARLLLAGVVLLATAVPGFSAARRNNPGFSTNTLAGNDDESTGLVNIGFPINFFGTTYTQLYVNNNGNVTFTNPLGDFTPFGLLNTSTPIIAAFFGDVDTRAGNIAHYGNDTVNGRNAFGVEWPGVGYFSTHTNKLNTFELLIIDRSDTGTGNFDIEFNYDQMQWETGDASEGINGLGGSPARVGYSNGSSTAFELPGSGVSGAFLDGGPNSLVGHSLNSGVNGRYLFQARNGTVIGSPAVGTPLPGTLGLVCCGFLIYGIVRFRRLHA